MEARSTLIQIGMRMRYSKSSFAALKALARSLKGLFKDSILVLEEVKDLNLVSCNS